MYSKRYSRDEWITLTQCYSIQERHWVSMIWLLLSIGQGLTQNVKSREMHLMRWDIIQQHSGDSFILNTPHRGEYFPCYSAAPSPQSVSFGTPAIVTHDGRRRWRYTVTWQVFITEFCNGFEKTECVKSYRCWMAVGQSAIVCLLPIDQLSPLADHNPLFWFQGCPKSSVLIDMSQQRWLLPIKGHF